MNLSLTHLKDQEVIQLTQDNMVNLMRTWSGFTNSFQVFEDENGFRISSSLLHPLFNNVLKTNIENNVKGFIKSIRKEYKKRKSPFLWRIWDHDTPKDIGALLLKNGAQEFQSITLMAIDLDNFHPIHERIPDLTVRTVSNYAEAKKFSECTCTTFGIPEQLKGPTTELIGTFNENIENYVGFIHDTAVGTATKYYSQGIVGIYNVATLPAFQGRGIGTEIMTNLLIKAKMDGYQIAILHATPAGFRLYEKLGFQPYGEIKQYFFE